MSVLHPPTTTHKSKAAARSQVPRGHPPDLLQCSPAKAPQITRRGEEGQPMAGVECQPKVSLSKRKAESYAGEECSLEDRASKKIDRSEAEKETATPVIAGDKGEEAPAAKKMWRLPQEEVNWILAQSNEPVCTEFRDLKRANPSLVPSPEEAKDKSTVLLYTCARECYEEEEKFAKFQAWVRCEYASKGFVEVDYDYFGRRAEAIRLSNEARDEVFKDWDLSSDSEDDYASKLIKRKIRSFF